MARQIIEYDIHKKNEGVAFALWVMFGWIGGHRMYLGVTNTIAIIQVLIIGYIWFNFRFDYYDFRIVGKLTNVLVGFAFLALIMAIDGFKIPGWTRQYNANVLEKIENGMVDKSIGYDEIPSQSPTTETYVGILVSAAVIIVAVILIVLNNNQ